MLDLLDVAAWNSSVLVLMQTIVPLGAPRERHDISSYFKSEAATVACF